MVRQNERQINRWERTVSRVRGKLVKMNKDDVSKFDDYSISPKVRQSLLHWGFELIEKDFFYWLDKLMYKNKLLIV